MSQQLLGFKDFTLIKNIRIAVLIMGTAILLFACGKSDLDKIKDFASPEDLPALEATNFETLYTDSGQVRFSLKTPKLLRFENDGESYSQFPEGIHLVKYDAKQKIISSLTADFAKQFIKEKKWEAKNNVVVTNAQGDSLKTEHLIWDEKSAKIYTEEFVTIIRQNQIMTGTGLISDQDMQNWTLTQPQGSFLVDVHSKAKQDSSVTETPEDTNEKELNEHPSRTKLKFK